MEISSSAPRPSPRACHDFVALYTERVATLLVALHPPVAEKVSQHRFAGGDVAGLLALIARKQTQAEARLGRTIRILSCYEAGYDGFWLHRLLCARGIDNRILVPSATTSRLPRACGIWVEAPMRATGYKVMRGFSADRPGEADPECVQPPHRRQCNKL